MCPCPNPLLASAHAELPSEGKQLVPAPRRGERWHVDAVKELQARKARKAALKAAGGAP